MDLKDYRQQIDDLDREMAAIFEKRMEISRLVAIYKKENNLPLQDIGREELMLEKLKESTGDELYPYSRKFFSYLLELSKDYMGSCMAQLSEDI